MVTSTRLWALAAACAIASSGVRAAAQQPGTAGTQPPALTELNLQDANQPSPTVFEREDIVKMLVWGYPELTHSATIQEDGTATFPLVGEVAAAGRTAAQIRDEIVRRFTTIADDQPRRIRREDTLTVSVWGQPDLTYTGEVQVDGRLTLPLIGTIQAEGRTLDEVKETIAAKMARYFRDPRVSVLPDRVVKDTVLNPRVSILPEKLRDRTVAVIGEVNRPGLYPIRGKLRVLEALAMAQYLESGQLNSVVLIRDYQGRPQYSALRLRDYINRKSDDQNVYLSSDDIVIVPKTFIAKVNTFVDQWFVGTRGIFDWWIALNYGQYVREYGEAVRLMNQSMTIPIPDGR
jgi:polysaccharide export outer membrane protein